jgi:hypothetical protein
VRATSAGGERDHRVAAQDVWQLSQITATYFRTFGLCSRMTSAQIEALANFPSGVCMFTILDPRAAVAVDFELCIT